MSPTELITAALLNPDIDPLLRTPATVDGDWIDMQDFERVIFIVSLGVAEPTGTLNVQIREANTAAGGTPLNVAGALITELIGTDDNSVVAIEVHQDDMTNDNAYRWLSARAVVGADDMTYGVVSMRHQTRRKPQTNVT